MLKGVLMKKVTKGSKAIPADQASKLPKKFTFAKAVQTKTSQVHEITTWSDLAKAISKLSKAEKSQPVQVVKTHASDAAVNELLPGVCLGSVGSLEIRFVRSSTDNRKHEEHVVLLVDGNPFGEEGASSYEMITKKVKGKKKILFHPNFPKNHTDECDWSGPAQKIIKEKEKKNPENTGEYLHEYDIQSLKKTTKYTFKYDTVKLTNHPPYDFGKKIKKKNKILE